MMALPTGRRHLYPKFLPLAHGEQGSSLSWWQRGPSSFNRISTFQDGVIGAGVADSGAPPAEEQGTTVALWSKVLCFVETVMENK